MNIPNRNIGKVVAISAGRRIKRQAMSPTPPKGNKDKKDKDGYKLRWYHYVQFVVFIAVMAYFVQLCSGGGF